jgi:hypothetical protein
MAILEFKKRTSSRWQCVRKIPAVTVADRILLLIKKIDTAIEYVCNETNENAMYICHFRVITMIDEASKIDRNLRSDGINMSATTRRIDWYMIENDFDRVFFRKFEKKKFSPSFLSVYWTAMSKYLWGRHWCCRTEYVIMSVSIKGKQCEKEKEWNPQLTIHHSIINYR